MILNFDFDLILSETTPKASLISGAVYNVLYEYNFPLLPGLALADCPI